VDLPNSLLSEIDNITNLKDLDDLRIKILGKNGILTEKLKKLSLLDPQSKREIGASLNVFKEKVTASILSKKEILEQNVLIAKLQSEKVDITLPVLNDSFGTIHPISKVISDVCKYFSQFGFAVKQGPDIETDEHNFDALNIPPHHPARQNHDTFFLKDINMLLRTHTSTVQIRTMRNEKPPLRILAPGRVYRSDYDATHTPMFHQIEGLVIDKNVHMGHLKATIIDFCRWFFEVDDLPVRFRPSFFPFTEPSAEVDIGCKRDGDHLKIGKGNDWLEILGSGMVHPKVLENCGINPNEYQGFAFGMGIERLAMLKYGIADIRNFYDGDTRWLQSHGFTQA
jgi:phenylalanyl-tRNA synthetase alpha chain